MGIAPADVPTASWGATGHESGNRLDEGGLYRHRLGKRIAAVVARRLLARENGLIDELPQLFNTVVIRGTEGMASSSRNAACRFPATRSSA